MGEEIAARESMYNHQPDGPYLWLDGVLPIHDGVCLHSFATNKLIYVHNAVFGYNKCKFNFTLEAALMFKGESIDGEIQRDC